jgi:ATP-dependent Clp protease ATP-binding subunit ClpA
MQLENSDSYLKFYEPFDIFLKVKKCQEEDLSQFFDEKNEISRNDYFDSLIELCFPEYEDKIKPHMEALQNHSDPMILEEMKIDLYQLCLQVNPQLNIAFVSLGAEKDLSKTQKIETEEIKTLPVADLRQKLLEEVIGQEAAIELVCQSLRRASIGLNDENRPIGSFLLVGNTGVGKTQLAKSLNHILFNNSENLIRIDCSEYSQSHECSKLIGSPPGYVGHEGGGVLTKAVGKMKKAVVLFDEIEKADPKVHHMLLQIIDEGRLSDSSGETVSFKDCVIIMTSNLGLKDSIRARKGPGFARVKAPQLSKDDAESLVSSALEDFFSPEFLNRIDNIVHFKDLSPEDCEIISSKFLEQTAARLRQKGYDISFDRSVAQKIVELGFDPRFGAREIKRQILHFVETPLSDQIIDGNLLKEMSILADIDNNQLTFKQNK